jgi:hypothetical protein
MRFPLKQPYRLLSWIAVISCCLIVDNPFAALNAQTSAGWAYKPLSPVTPPQVKDATESENPIDAFIIDGLKRNQLAPNPEADKMTLVRRAYYDLTGLPPTQEQMDAFLSNDSPQAWSQLIDQLLDSPHYGEKWGRHWLDLVRWAESSGYERDTDKRNMWKYRDYVIDAVNDDKPYDEFIIDQIAGDVRPDKTPESTIASGFLHLGVYDDEPADEEQFLFDYYDDIINTVSRSMLATSMSCARCHDHKIDPLSQKEYYQFLSYFRNLHIPLRIRNQDTSTVSIFDPEEETELNQQLNQGILDIATPRIKQWQAINAVANLADSSADKSAQPKDLSFGFLLDDWTYTRGELEQTEFLVQGELENGLIHLASDITQITPSKIVPSTYLFNGTFEQPEEATLTFRVNINGGAWMYLGDELVFSKVGANQIQEDFEITLPAGSHTLKLIASRHRDLLLELSLVQNGKEIPWVVSDSWKKINALVGRRGSIELDKSSPWGKIYQENSERENAALKVLEPIEQALTESLVTAAYNAAEEKPTHILMRGNPHSPGEEVNPGLPGVLGKELPTTVEGEDRRLTLAKWIADKQNPVTPRVAVNRIWQHHFGRGIVRSSDEFGGLGDAPTHPELLDWLANEFVEMDWRMKPLHRLIMNSATYKMSSAPNEAALSKDPQNDHFWRFNMRRLTAEEIRDSVLVTANHFNPQVGGPSVFPTLPEEVLATASRAEQRWDLEAGPEHQNRRSIYTFTRRSLLDPLMSTFDSADTDTACPVRFNTTVPAQALTMMNSEFIAKHAELLSQRIKQEADGDDMQAVVSTGFELVLGRLPATSELQESIGLIEALQRDFGHDSKTAIDRFALMMLNLNEFMFLD